jgi:hypothetical protein
VSTLQMVAAPPSSSSYLSSISWMPSLDPLELLGAAGRGAGRFGRIGFLQGDEGGAWFCLGDFYGSWQIADWKHGFYSMLPRG